MLQGDDPATAESLLGKVLKYENSIKLLSEQLSAQVGTEQRSYACPHVGILLSASTAGVDN